MLLINKHQVQTLHNFGWAGSSWQTNRSAPKVLKQHGQKSKTCTEIKCAHRICFDVSPPNFAFQNNSLVMECITVDKISSETPTNLTKNKGFVSVLAYKEYQNNWIILCGYKIHLLHQPLLLLSLGVKESEMNEYVVIGLGLGVISIVIIAVFLLCHRKRKRRRLEHPSNP